MGTLRSQLQSIAEAPVPRKPPEREVEVRIRCVVIFGFFALRACAAERRGPDIRHPHVDGTPRAMIPKPSPGP